MNRGEKEICCVLSNDTLFCQIREQLKDNFFLQDATSTDNAVSLIRKQSVLCLIVRVADKTNYSPLDVSLFARQFPTIPLIAVVDGNNFDLILSCAQMGEKEIVTKQELCKLKEKLFLITEEQKLRGGVRIGLIPQIVRGW